MLNKNFKILKVHDCGNFNTVKGTNISFRAEHISKKVNAIARPCPSNAMGPTSQTAYDQILMSSDTLSLISMDQEWECGW